MLSTAPALDGPGKGSTKKPLFTKPSWSKIQNVGTSDLFHRSDQTYMASAADAERKRREKLAKKERARMDQNEERASKRQRFSVNNDDDANKNIDDGNVDDEDEDEDDDQSEYDDSSSDRIDGPIVTDMPSKSPPKSIPTLVDNFHKRISELKTNLEKNYPDVSTVINIDDDESFTDGPEFLRAKPVEATKISELIEDEIIPSDEEFPELAWKARENAKRKRFEKAVTPVTSDPPPSALSEPPHMSPSRTIPPPLDPVLQILITSSIPDTTPLVVSRKLGQRLKDVRLAWTDRQPLSRESKDNVFLTCRGKRLFDVTTCKSLGVTVNLDGRVMAKGDSLGDDEGRIHMEAMTPEILEARRRAKTQETTQEEDMEAENETQPGIEDKKENQVRIILKARGFQDFKLKVKPVTSISKILNAFRHTNKIDSEKYVYILFEGERLEPTNTIEDSEIADLDCLDTYVK